VFGAMINDQIRLVMALVPNQRAQMETANSDNVVAAG
jgi:hypothetical protein